MPCIPSRTSQNTSISSGTPVNAAVSSSSWPSTAASARSSIPSSCDGSSVRSSTSSTAPSGGTSRHSSGMPGSE